MLKNRDWWGVPRIAIIRTHMPQEGSEAVVSVGDQVFALGGDGSFGAVRAVHRHQLVIDIEGHGDEPIPAAAVVEVTAGKVVLDTSKLTLAVREAIQHAHVQETQ
jgi:hypothetical protein